MMHSHSTRQNRLHRIGAILLAAGASRRLGTPKQLLQYEGQPLVRRIASQAIQAAFEPVIVVTGAHAEAVQMQLSGDEQLQTVLNPQWKRGMGESIACGMTALLPHELDAVIVLPCDQPAVNVRLLATFRNGFEGISDRIIVSDYGIGQGPPVLFGRDYFEALAHLSGEQGARCVIQAAKTEPRSISFPEGSKDVDTSADCAFYGMTAPAAPNSEQ